MCYESQAVFMLFIQIGIVTQLAKFNGTLEINFSSAKFGYKWISRI